MSRRTDDEINAAITTSLKKPREEGTDSSGKVIDVIGYTLKKSITRDRVGRHRLTGPPEISIDDPKCYAKKSRISKPDGQFYEKYFIKISPDGFLYDPFGLHTEGKEAEFAREEKLGRPTWSWVDITKRCFNFYLQYLETRNAGYLKNAEREIR